MDHNEDEKLRFYVACTVIAFCAVFGAILYIGGLAYLFLSKPLWMIMILKKHFAAVVIPPLMMVGAIMVVVSLRISEGPIKFKILGFEFEGASAPIIMWALVYMIFLASVQLLWGLK